MKTLKLNNEIDTFATAELASVQNARGIAEIVSSYIETLNSEDDFEVTIAKKLLSDSYTSNPSILATKILAKLPQEEWKDCAGFQTPGKITHVTIKILRTRKNGRRFNPFPSVKALIKNWLQLNLSKSRRLTIPTSSIPAFFFSHPEQLTYQVKQETQTPIKITKLKSSWLISRK